MKKQFTNQFLGAALLAFSIIFSSCYSVFNGGTGGQIVDAESTSTPKAGIAYVDIYAYTDDEIRDEDFNSWIEGTVFTPSNTYYGHTTTDASGSFTLSNIVWKETNPDFGKDADYTSLYLLYYHENYGLIKDETIITSGSTSDTVYAELTAIRKTTALNINIYDVSTGNASNNNVLVTVSVPQSTERYTAAPKVYKQTITGNGTINISYPRWLNAEAKKNGIENTPEVNISYSQSADEIIWKACANADNPSNDYSFLADDFVIAKTIKNPSYNISLYGKATRLNIPSVSGTFGNTSDSANDGKIIKMTGKNKSGLYTIDCGETTTFAQTVGSSGTQTHGNFANLGNGFFWTDESYTGKYTTIEVKFFADGLDTGITKTLRSDTASYNVTLQNRTPDEE